MTRFHQRSCQHPRMSLSTRQLNRATLARQLLLHRERVSVVEAVHRVVALQAQEAASPYIGLWNRIEKFEATDLDKAFARHHLVKATLMRVTLHVVDAADYPSFHAAMQPTLQGARLHDARFRRAGMSKDEFHAFVPEVLAYAATPRTNAEAEAWVDERLGEVPKPSVWWALRQVAPLVHAPSGPPWSFGPRPSYVAARDVSRAGDPTASLPVLVRRYLEGFGPASVQDIGQFTMLHRPRIRAAIESLGDAVERHAGAGTSELFDVPGAPLPDEDVVTPPRLLPMWDSTLLAYADRGRVIPEAYRRVVIRSNGDVLPTLLVDGFVAGAWRPVDDGIEATAFHRLDADAWAGLDAEARALRAFLAGRERQVYRRYVRWWASLPSAEVRVLGG
jgi:hypothetical protein